MSYSIASQVKTYRPSNGYNPIGGDDHPLVPHGLSVIVTAPSVFNFTGIADPERHGTCAQILADTRNRRQNLKITKYSYNDTGAWLAKKSIFASLKIDFLNATFLVKIRRI